MQHAGINKYSPSVGALAVWMDAPQVVGRPATQFSLASLQQTLHTPHPVSTLQNGRAAPLFTAFHRAFAACHLLSCVVSLPSNAYKALVVARRRQTNA